jgi:hypothetical protein
VKSQQVRFGCGNTLVAEWNVTGPASVEARIAADLRPERGELRLWWELPGARSPADDGQGGDHREIALAFENITFSRRD